MNAQILPKYKLTTLAKNGVLCLLFVIPFFSFAQKPDNQRIESLKIGFLTQKLGLSAEEAKVFWPIYNDYNREFDELRKNRFQNLISFKKTEKIDELPDAEINKLILNDFDFKQQELNLEKKYYARFKSAMPLKIVGKYYRAREAFKKELLTRFRNDNKR